MPSITFYRCDQCLLWKSDAVPDLCALVELLPFWHFQSRAWELPKAHLVNVSVPWMLSTTTSVLLLTQEWIVLFADKLSDLPSSPHCLGWRHFETHWCKPQRVKRKWTQISLLTSFPGVVLILITSSLFYNEENTKTKDKNVSLCFNYPCSSVSWNYYVVDGCSFKVVNANGQTITTGTRVPSAPPDVV